MRAGSFSALLLASTAPQGDRLCVCPQDTPFLDLTGRCKDSQSRMVGVCLSNARTVGRDVPAESSPATSVSVLAGDGACPAPEAGSLRRGVSLSPSVSDLGAACVFMSNACPWTPGHVAGRPCVSGSPKQLLPSPVPAFGTLTVI